MFMYLLLVFIYILWQIITNPLFKYSMKYNIIIIKNNLRLPGQAGVQIFCL